MSKIKRFNIVLLPDTLSSQMIDLAKIFSKDTDYLLGSNSRPHITLKQFHLDENQLDVLWDAYLPIYLKQFPKKISIALDRVSVSQDENKAWLALLVDTNCLSFQIEKSLRALLKEKGIPYLGREIYDPHLTIARTADKDVAREFSERKVYYQDQFHLGLGLSDELGQLVQILKTL
jgi:2'-5' RNA ligase